MKSCQDGGGSGRGRTRRSGASGRRFAPGSGLQAPDPGTDVRLGGRRVGSSGAQSGRCLAAVFDGLEEHDERARPVAGVLGQRPVDRQGFQRLAASGDADHRVLAALVVTVAPEWDARHFRKIVRHGGWGEKQAARGRMMTASASGAKRRARSDGPPRRALSLRSHAGRWDREPPSAKEVPTDRWPRHGWRRGCSASAADAAPEAGRGRGWCEPGRARVSPHRGAEAPCARRA